MELISIPKEQCEYGMIKLGCNYSSNVIPIANKDKNSFGEKCKAYISRLAVVGNGSSIEVRQNGNIYIGKNFGNTGTLSMCHDCEINIGENVLCIWDVSIFDMDLHSYVDGETMLPLPHIRPVTIGNYLWIYQKCTLLKGAVLHDWSVLGACSLLTRNYPPSFLVRKILSNVFVENPA